MLFKQIQIFNLNKTLSIKTSSLLPKLEALKFTPCLPSFATSCGWTAPLQEDNGPLVHQTGQYLIFCVRHEDKILPASVIRDAVEEKIKELELKEDRKVHAKEKRDMRTEITQTMLPKAFSKKALVFGYIDTENQLLILNTNQKDRTKTFLSLLKKSLEIDATPLKLKKTAYVLTQWVNHDTIPKGITILDQSVLQDPDQARRMIRSQAQDLFSTPMQGFLKEGFEVKQLAVAWQDALEFTIAEGLLIKAIKYRDDLLAASEEEIEHPAQRFDANFIIMAETFKSLLPVLMEEFLTEGESNIPATTTSSNTEPALA